MTKTIFSIVSLSIFGLLAVPLAAAMLTQDAPSFDGFNSTARQEGPSVLRKNSGPLPGQGNSPPLRPQEPTLGRTIGQASGPAMWRQSSSVPGPRAILSTYQRPGGMPPQINLLLRELQSAKDEDAKKTIAKKLRTILSEEFDQRLKQPAQRIQSSRKRLSDLNERLTLRSDNRDAMVDLRLKVLLNQAIGLGWMDDSRHRGPFPTNASSMAPVGGTTFAAPPNFAPASSPRYPSNRAVQIAERVTGVLGIPGPGGSPKPRTQGYSSQRQPAKVRGPAPLLPNTRPNDIPSQLELMRDYADTNDEDERKSISDKLRELLVEEYDRNQNDLKKAAEQIEKQVSDLESNIKKRKQAKDSIVDLMLKTLINQANGLGF